MDYNWQQPDWPEFLFDTRAAEDALLLFRDKAGQVSGMLKALPEGLQADAIVDLLIAEAIKTSEIEGEFLSRRDVMSSIRNQLGLNTPAEPVRDKASEGAAELMVDVRRTWNEPLSESKLLQWHRMLMKADLAEAGRWRTHEDPMQVVSGRVGNLRVHFEAPPSAQVPAEMRRFLKWFNQSLDEYKHAPVRAAVAHLYFESIHPFHDGNGRIGRAVAEKALSQGLSRPALLSLSRTIEADRASYYRELVHAQHSLEVSQWVAYFADVVLKAQNEAEEHVDFILRKTKFFDRHRPSLSERQLRVVRRMLDEGPAGFEGGMNVRKYRSLTSVSKATATRDLQDLVEKTILTPIGQARNTRYELNL